MTVLDAQALDDIACGACVLGSGGGGALTEGRALASSLPVITLVEARDVADDARMAVSAAIGSPTAAAGQDLSSAAVAAYQELEKANGTTFTHVLVGEIGAVNALIPMLPAARLGLPVVDASSAPRALPLLANAIFADTVPISPIALATANGAFTISAPNAETADPMLRGLVSSPGFPDCAGFALWSMDGATMKRQALPGTVERAREVGALLRGPEPVEAVCHLLGATVLFKGRNLAVQQTSGGGFDVGTVTIDDGDDRLTIFEQDENLVAWRRGASAPVAMAPDLICYLTADGRPFSNAGPDMATITPSTEVVVIGVPAAHLDFAGPSVVASFAGVLGALGYPGPYVPVGA